MILYALISAISIFVRNFVLPNPFECFGESAVVINWIAEPIIQFIAHSLVGLVYLKGSAPALGSLLYLIVYASLVGVLALFGVFAFELWWILLCIMAFSAVVLAIRYLWLRITGEL